MRLLAQEAAAERRAERARMEKTASRVAVAPTSLKAGPQGPSPAVRRSDAPDDQPARSTREAADEIARLMRSIARRYGQMPLEPFRAAWEAGGDLGLAAWRRVPDFPALWKLLGFLFTPKFRDRVWTPVIGEDQADYATAMRGFARRPWSRRWIRVCFLLRTAYRLGQCFWQMGLGGLVTMFAAMMPEVIRAIWRVRP